jgi:hypothetical protein
MDQSRPQRNLTIEFFMSLSTDMSLQLLGSAESRVAALDYVSEAFAEAVLDGVEVEAFAEAAIATALRELVAAHGEERVANIVQTFPERVRAGEFSSRLTQ